MKAAVQEKYNQTGYELNIQQVKLLTELGNELTRSVTVVFDANAVSGYVIQDLERILGEHGPGRIPLKVLITDSENKLVVDATSKKNKASI